MPVARRRADTEWHGSAAEGSGTLTLSTSNAATFPVSLSKRAEESDKTQTNPEELIAAAHSSCYAMAFSNYLSSNGNVPDELRVNARVTLDKAGEGFAITESVLTVEGKVPGLDQAAFEQAAKEAELQCPVSNALRNNLEIEVEAKLVS